MAHGKSSEAAAWASAFASLTGAVADVTQVKANKEIARFQTASLERMERAAGVLN